NQLSSPYFGQGKAVRFYVNQGPTANIGPASTVNEGSGSLVLNATASSDPNEANTNLLYEWDLDGDGIFGEVGTGAHGHERGPTPTFTYLNLDNGSLPIALRVTDTSGATSSQTSSITIANVAPTANAGGPYNVNEEGSVTLSGSATDPAGGLDPLTY